MLQPVSNHMKATAPGHAHAESSHHKGNGFGNLGRRQLTDNAQCAFRHIGVQAQSLVATVWMTCKQPVKLKYGHGEKHVQDSNSCPGAGAMMLLLLCRPIAVHGCAQAAAQISKGHL